MVQYNKDNYSFTREFSFKVPYLHGDDLGCLGHLILVIINFAIFGFFVGQFTLFLGICVVWVIHYIKTADRKITSERPDTIAVEVPIRELNVSLDFEDRTIYSVVVIHPESGWPCTFNISSWEYLQLEKGSLVTLVYAPHLPDYYELKVNRFIPMNVVAEWPMLAAPVQSDPASLTSIKAQYYQDRSSLLITVGITKNQDIADILSITVFIILFLTPMFMLMSGLGWRSLFLYPVFIFGFVLLEKGLPQWRKRAFMRAEKKTAPALVRGKHRGGNGLCFVVLEHPENGNEITFPVDAVTFERSETGQYLDFTYAPELPGQYCL